MRWALAVATLLALALAAVLVARTLKREAATTSTVPGPAAPATPCPDATLRPPPARADLSAAPLSVELEPGIAFSLDGAGPGDSLSAGRHALLASSPGLKPSRLELQVESFTPVLLDVRAAFGAVTVVVIGARCVSCANTGATPDLKYDPAVPGDLAAVSGALATGDWVEAARALRAIPPTEREKPEVIRLLAALYAFAARPSLLRAELELLPDTTPVRRALIRRDALDELKESRQLKSGTARWNATTERFQRLSDRFVSEAHEPLTALSLQFDGLSKRVADALEAKDAIGCETALETANGAVADLVMTLRAQRPTDCEWQKRITDAL